MQHLLVGRRRVGVIDGRRAARQHDAGRMVAFDFVERGRAGQHDGEDVLFADAARDELRILRAKVEDDDRLGFHHLLCQRDASSVKRGFQRKQSGEAASCQLLASQPSAKTPPWRSFYLWSEGCFRPAMACRNMRAMFPLIGKAAFVLALVVSQAPVQNNPQASLPRICTKDQVSTAQEPCALPPHAIHTPYPSYTSEARAAKIEGNVELSVVVGADGTPSERQGNPRSRLRARRSVNKYRAAMAVQPGNHRWQAGGS